MKWAVTTALSQPTQGPKDTAQHYRSQHGNTHGAVSAAHSDWPVQPKFTRLQSKELQLKVVDRHRAKPKVCSVLSGAAGHSAPTCIFIANRDTHRARLQRCCINAKPAHPKQLTALKPQALCQPRCPKLSQPHSARPLRLVTSVSTPGLGNSASEAAWGQVLWVNTPI